MTHGPHGAFDVTEVERATGASRRSLHTWDRAGVVSPSIPATAGSAPERRYAFQDVVVVGIVQWMRQVGLPLRLVRRVTDGIRTAALPDRWLVIGPGWPLQIAVDVQAVRQHVEDQLYGTEAAPQAVPARKEPWH